jgi:hypothetical protein
MPGALVYVFLHPLFLPYRCMFDICHQLRTCAKSLDPHVHAYPHPPLTPRAALLCLNIYGKEQQQPIE